MKRIALAAAAAVSAASAYSAVDISSLAGLRFAEEYAFSTNRAALVSTLRPDTKEWFALSILSAQTEGRTADARALLDRWEAASGGSARNPEWDAALWRSLLARQYMLEWDKDETTIWRLTRALDSAGIACSLPERETELEPDTYPSSLPPESVSYKAFAKERSRLKNAYRFLYLTDPDSWPGRQFSPARSGADVPADTPGLYEDVVDYLRTGGKGAVFRDSPPFSNLTVAQLEALQRDLKGTDKDVSSSDAFAKTMLAKIGSPGADDDPSSPEVRRAILERCLAFTATLAPSLRAHRISALEDAIEFALDTGNLPEKTLLLEYCTAARPGDGKPSAANSGLVRRALVALRTAGEDISAYAPLLEKDFVAKTAAEADLLAGKSAEEAGAAVLSSAEYTALSQRRELSWANSNPTTFPAAGNVELAVEVKNVPNVRVRVYEMDAFAACRAAKGEMPQDIDLDSAVPTAERTLDFPGVHSMRRHLEKISLPELAEPGLYVVECSGAGLSSRAVVRKGGIRAVERPDASGHVFTAFAPDGRVLPDASLWLDGSVFTADESGEIAVPFRQAGDSRGNKTAIVKSGRLAAPVSFHHATEHYLLFADAAIPPESLVEGQEATVLIRPRLVASGVPAPLAILENPVLRVEFTDLSGRSVVKTVPGFEVSDSAESVFRFTVPRRLARVEFSLSGTVKKATDGETVRLESAPSAIRTGSIASTGSVGQLFLRRGPAGYTVEARGRSGEPLPSRAIAFNFRHVAFASPIEKTLQCGTDGTVALGALSDIESVEAQFDGNRYFWPVAEERVDRLPQFIAGAEGDAFTIPARGLLDGSWPGAGSLPVRVSLLGVDAAGRVTGDFIKACSYAGGILRIAGLPAGDYRLEIRTTGESIPVSVTKTATRTPQCGVLAGGARMLADTGAQNALAVQSATVSENGVLNITLSGFDSFTRVHVTASRTSAEEYGRGVSPFYVLAGALEPQSLWREIKCPPPRAAYISGRNLGDTLQYIMDRRRSPGRIGNMLFRPSLILNPWSTTSTSTARTEMGDGDGWAGLGRDDSSASRNGSVKSAAREPARASGTASFDFMPSPAAVIPNLRPDASGAVMVDLSALAGMQDISVIATDGRSIDEVSLVRPAAPVVPRNIAAGPAPAARSGASRAYSTVGELHSLLQSIDPGDSAFAEFGFVRNWDALVPAAKEALYGKYACHELDFFLHEKDPAFFASTVAPSLRNKRFKQFVDKWLLGEDLEEYASPAAILGLNAFERCLLAMRVPSARASTLRCFSDFCSAQKRDLDEDDRRLSIALDDMGARAGKPETAEEEAYAADAMMEDAEAPLPLCAIAPAAEGLRAKGEMRAGRDASAVKRRAAKQFYKPVEKTREWVETHYWRRRHAESTASLAAPNRFWRDCAAAIAEGRLDSFRSANILDAAGTFSEKMFALAVVRVGFKPQDGAEVAFSRAAAAAAPGAPALPVKLVQRFCDPGAQREDGTPGADVSGPFVRGKQYIMETVAMNPSKTPVKVNLSASIPEGAVPLKRADYTVETSLDLDSYDVETVETAFYFPFPGAVPFTLQPAVASAPGYAPAQAEGQSLEVSAAPPAADRSGWDYVSQKGDKSEVLAYLREKNLALVDIDRIGWRMKDGEFARAALGILAARGAYSQNLWLCGLKWKGSFDTARIREALAAPEARKRLAGVLGPVFRSSLVEIDPEETDVFEHREYWPIVNALAHPPQGRALANKALESEYAAFLSVLAAKPAPEPRDRLLAAVYLLAQDRTAEARALVSSVSPADVETQMQLDYMNAYLAFGEGDAEYARAIAAKYAAWPVPLWRGRFAEIVAQADEAAGAAGPSGEASAAPSLALRAVQDGGSVSAVAVTARNLETCTVSAYPVDAEVAFSKNPFGGGTAGGLLSLRPAWSVEIEPGGKGEAEAALPRALRNSNLVIVASGAGGAATARCEVAPCSLDVQVAAEYRRIGVRDSSGKPVPGAYVKVYSRRAGGGAVFRKDGYTDVRGAFDYESVSTEDGPAPDEFAVFVQKDGAGAKTLAIPASR